MYNHSFMIYMYEEETSRRDVLYSFLSYFEQFIDIVDCSFEIRSFIILCESK